MTWPPNGKETRGLRQRRTGSYTDFNYRTKSLSVVPWFGVSLQLRLGHAHRPQLPNTPPSCPFFPPTGCGGNMFDLVAAGEGRHGRRQSGSKGGNKWRLLLGTAAHADAFTCRGMKARGRVCCGGWTANLRHLPPPPLSVANQ